MKPPKNLKEQDSKELPGKCRESETAQGAQMLCNPA
jgi:hypothetical protein